jgi:hypothetical protein
MESVKVERPLTKREFVAAVALAALMTHGIPVRDAVCLAVATADALLAELNEATRWATVVPFPGNGDNGAAG